MKYNLRYCIFLNCEIYISFKKFLLCNLLVHILIDFFTILKFSNISQFFDIFLKPQIGSLFFSYLYFVIGGSGE